MKTWKGQEFEREWYRAMLEWIDGGRVGEEPVWQTSGDQQKWYVDANLDYPMMPNLYYRWAPKPKPKRTVTINGKVLVAPEVDAPAKDRGYFFIDLTGAAIRMRWDGCTTEVGCLTAGNVFLTREDAQAMADWLVKCRRGET